MFFAFVLIACMVIVMVFFLMMHNRAIGNVIVTKARVFVGRTDIQATDIVLEREVVRVTIIDRLNLKAKPNL